MRIHVERVIGAVRQRFTMLSSTLPIEAVARRDEDIEAAVDKVARVCCALYNVGKSMVTVK